MGLVLLAAVGAGSVILVRRHTATDRRSAAARLRADDLAILDSRIAFYSARVTREPRGALDLGRLAALYLQRGRQTGSYEDLGRSELTARRSYGNRRARNGGAALVLSQSLLAQHRYLEAYQVARAVAESDSTEIEPRALQAELELELGRYEDAARSFRSLDAERRRLSVSTRYARWLEIQGHDSDAYRLLLAAESLATRQFRLPAEQRAWFHLRAADFALRHGRLGEASAALGRGLDVAPDDYRLLALEARLCAARGDWPGTLHAGSASIAQVLDPATLGLMADAAAATGDSAGSAQFARTMQVAVAAQPGPYHRAAALYLLDHGGPMADVLQRVEAEARTRQDVYGLDLQAWALFHNGRNREADSVMTKALATGIHDAQFEFHAARIARSLGDDAGAEWHLAQARADNSSLPALARAGN